VLFARLTDPAENRRLRNQITELKAQLAIAYGQRRAEL
jgi:hypothetical protein